jgi:hypothetical protein
MAAWGTGQVESRQEELQQVYTEYLAATPTPPDPDPAAVPEEKLKALLGYLEAEPLFRGTYGSQYPSQSEADWHLCKLALGQGWTDAEVTALLREARANAGADSKYPGYHQLTIRRRAGSPARWTWRKPVGCSGATCTCRT